MGTTEREGEGEGTLGGSGMHSPERPAWLPLSRPRGAVLKPSYSVTFSLVVTGHLNCLLLAWGVGERWEVDRAGGS